MAQKVTWIYFPRYAVASAIFTVSVCPLIVGTAALPRAVPSVDITVPFTVWSLLFFTTIDVTTSPGTLLAVAATVWLFVSVPFSGAFANSSAFTSVSLITISSASSGTNAMMSYLNDVSKASLSL